MQGGSTGQVSEGGQHISKVPAPDSWKTGVRLSLVGPFVIWYLQGRHTMLVGCKLLTQKKYVAGAASGTASGLAVNEKIAAAALYVTDDALTAYVTHTSSNLLRMKSPIEGSDDGVSPDSSNAALWNLRGYAAQAAQAESGPG